MKNIDRVGKVRVFGDYRIRRLKGGWYGVYRKDRTCIGRANTLEGAKCFLPNSTRSRHYECA